MNLKSPFFSIVIPLYNKEKYVKSTLNSVFNQSFKDFEIIVVNDGSTDDSLKIIESYNSNEIKIYSQDNSGVSVARNMGIEKAKGGYICFLDADDYWYPDHLINFKDSIDKYPLEKVFCNNYEILYTEQNIKSTKFNGLETNKNIIKIEDYFENSLLNSIAWTSAVCIKRDVLINNLLFDPFLKSGQDTDLWVRLGLLYNFIFNKSVSARHKKNISDSLSNTNNVEYRYLFTQKYLEEEKKNKTLKAFMDNNRFSVLIKFKLANNKEKINILTSQIKKDNLNSKQILLSNTPNFILNMMLKIKRILDSNGLFFYLYK